MNVILLDDTDFADTDTVHLSGRRVQHMNQVLACAPGDELAVGRVNGKLGRAKVTKISARSAVLAEVVLDDDPPPPLPVTLVLALPRPIVMNRLLAAVTSLGVKRIWLIHSRRVEKSYWQSPVLAPENIDQQFRLGLEQAIDTVLPEVRIHKRFKPFIEDELPGLIRNGPAWLAHPGDGGPVTERTGPQATLIIGPEGGFIPYEVDRFDALGVSRLSLGPRILRVETAVHVAVAEVGGLFK
ncbi:MAG: 16S rRNA (uracil(1498)-N(3))-methyltransferase [Candidatus Omnitrophica bacterium]|nr:16S rRNA (uracil(1498)-N(3))-methyltransferase [Candidatus Omnitrophota bacterium]